MLGEGCGGGLGWGTFPPHPTFAASCELCSQGVFHLKARAIGRLALPLEYGQVLLPGLPPPKRQETNYRKKHTHCNANAQKGPPPRH